MDWQIKIRAWSVFIPLVLILVSAIFFPDNKNYWIFLLVVAMITGYTHFFIGTFYQVKSIYRNENSRILFIAFILIAILSFLLGQGLIRIGYSIPLGMFTLTYFVLHVLLNEHTFLNQAQYKVTYPIMLSVLPLLVPLFFMSLTHPSFFYTFDLQYNQLSVDEQLSILSKFISVPTLQMFSIVIALFFLFSAPNIFYKRFGLKAGLLMGLLGLTVLTVVSLNIPVNFVYMVHGVLVFHFILMSLIFYKPIKEKGESALRKYINLHLYLLIPLILLSVIHYFPHLEYKIIDNIFSATFNFGFFLTISLTHISVSFLNEPWFRKLFI